MEELSLEEMKERMMERLQQGGKLGTLKAGIRKMMFQDLGDNGDAKDQKGLAQIALDTIMLEYLKVAKYHFSTSVFVSEANLMSSSVNKLSLEDAHKVLADLSTTHECIKPLISTLQQVKRAGCIDAEVQAGEQDVFRLDYKLQQIDEDFKLLKMQQREPSVTERMRRFEEQVHEESKKAVATEVEQIKRHELTQMRLQEAEKCERKFSERVRELQEQDRKMHHELQMEKFELQARQRSIEFQAMQLEKERVEYTQAMQSREANMTAVQKEVIAKDDRILKLEQQLNGTLTELRASRDICAELSAKQRHYTAEIGRLQDEHDRELQKRSDEWGKWHKERSLIIQEYERKVEENDLLLQNRTEEMRREFEAKKRELGNELERAKADLRVEEENLRADVEKEVKAGFSAQITELQERQTEFCRTMVEAQMKLDKRRQEVEKDASLLLSPKRIRPKSLRDRVAPRRAKGRSAKNHILRMLPDGILDDSPVAESLPDTPSTDDIIEVMRAQNKKNYKLLGEDELLSSPGMVDPPDGLYMSTATEPQPVKKVDRKRVHDTRVPDQHQYQHQHQHHQHPRYEHANLPSEPTQSAHIPTLELASAPVTRSASPQRRSPLSEQPSVSVPHSVSPSVPSPTSLSASHSSTAVQWVSPRSQPPREDVQVADSVAVPATVEQPQPAKQFPETATVPSSNSSPAPPSPPPVLPPTEEEEAGRSKIVHSEFEAFDTLFCCFRQFFVTTDESRERGYTVHEYFKDFVPLCILAEEGGRQVLCSSELRTHEEMMANQDAEWDAFPKAMIEKMRLVAAAKMKREQQASAQEKEEEIDNDSVEMEPFEDSSSSDNKWSF